MLVDAAKNLGRGKELLVGTSVEKLLSLQSVRGTKAIDMFGADHSDVSYSTSRVRNQLVFLNDLNSYQPIIDTLLFALLVYSAKGVQLPSYRSYFSDESIACANCNSLLN